MRQSALHVLQRYIQKVQIILSHGKRNIYVILQFVLYHAIFKLSPNISCTMFVILCRSCDLLLNCLSSNCYNLVLLLCRLFVKPTIDNRAISLGAGSMVFRQPLTRKAALCFFINFVFLLFHRAFLDKNE